MKNAILLLAVTALVASCHDSSKNSLSRDQQSYGVVQESAGGTVTSTINGPGEGNPAAAPMTATNVDTTSNLTLLPGTATAAGAPGTLAGALPPGQNGSMSMGYPTDATGRPTRRPRVARPAQPRVAVSETTTNAQPPMRSQPPMTSAAAPSEPAPSTNTSAPVETARPSDQKDKPKESKPSSTPPPPSTDTVTPTPPTTST